MDYFDINVYVVLIILFEVLLRVTGLQEKAKCSSENLHNGTTNLVSRTKNNREYLPINKTNKIIPSQFYSICEEKIYIPLTPEYSIICMGKLICIYLISYQKM